MDRPVSSQPPPSSSKAENPVVALGQKVKAVLSTSQRPSVRILRGSSSTGEPRRVPVSKSVPEKPVPANLFADARNRAGAAIRSLFGSDENVTRGESFEHEYDTDTVDLMDVMGM